MTDESLDKLTATMLEELGLNKCADVLVGGALLKGISGGERKRTSVGVELVAHPALVFLDEPTSGLDSHNALVMCQLLKKVANAGASVMLTIHQPSSEIFASLDRLILLNQGRVMYQGLIPDVHRDFAHRGFPVPKHFNVADHIMRVALLHTEPELEDAGFFPEDTRTLAEPFHNDDQHDSDRDALGITKHDKDKDHSPPPGIGEQTEALFRREIKNLYRNTRALKARTAMTLAISLLIGALFFQVATYEFNVFINIQSTFGALLMSLTANVFSTALPALTTFPEERPVFLREYSTNHYSIVSYFLSRLTMEFAITAIQVTVSTVITFFLVGFSLPYWQLWTAVYLMALTSSALGVMVGSAAETATTAIELLPAVFMPQILFSGFFVPPEIMPDWLAWITWIMPLTYGVKIIMAGELGNGRCGDNMPNYCEETLANSNVDTDDVWWYYLVLLILFIFFRLLALFVLRRKATKFY
jgi:energy-coupling factor transporter ATP-binding protein EcfA2/ABC-type multidrug transport system permease subunit